MTPSHDIAATPRAQNLLTEIEELEALDRMSSLPDSKEGKEEQTVKRARDEFLMSSSTSTQKMIEYSTPKGQPDKLTIPSKISRTIANHTLELSPKPQ